jgi:hypothetical protein
LLDDLTLQLRGLPTRRALPKTNFDPSVWEVAMRASGLDWLDPWLFDYVLDGLTEGFEPQIEPGHFESAKRNLPTNMTEDVVISQWILEAYENRWVLGPFSEAEVQADEELQRVQVSPIGCVPKPAAACGVRPYIHLSAPVGGASVNSRAKKEWCTVQYPRMRDVARIVLHSGRQDYLWVADAADAFLQLRMRPQHRYLMGFKWLGLLLIFASFMFGIATAPRNYGFFGDVVEHIICHRCGEEASYDSDAVRMVRRYVDDYFGGASTFAKADFQLSTLRSVWTELAVPFKERKISAPAVEQKILGFIWNCATQSARLPEVKRLLYMRNIRWALRQRSISLLDLQSLVGKLRWAAQVCFGAQAFVRRLELSLYMAADGRMGRHMSIRAVTKMDLQVYLSMLESMGDGISVSYLLQDESQADLCVESDASSRIGFGAVASTGEFFQLRWIEV